ncbi:MAG: hypothetical protein ACREMY_05665 [bacterium]
MKRMIISGCLAAIAAGLVAAPASAATKSFQGSITGGGKVAFDAKFTNGKPKSVTNVFFTKVPVHCSNGDTKFTFSYTGTVPVKDRKFSYVFQSFKASFHGTINRKGNKANGTVNFGPNTSNGHTNCTTGGARDWSAST